MEEREDSCAESNGCAKRIVALEWGKVSRGFFARSLVLAISRQKGGRPDLLDSLRISGFLQSKREEANGGVHLQPLRMLLRSGILIPIENREETLPKVTTWGDTEVRHLLDLCLNPRILEGSWVPNIPKITMFRFPKHLRMFVTLEFIERL